MEFDGIMSSVVSFMPDVVQLDMGARLGGS